MRMFERNRAIKLLLGGVGLAALSLVGCEAMGTKSGVESRMVETPSIARGKYLVLIGGCNDCHTAGYEQPGSNVTEETWLTGVPVGFKGPWGTTYPTNLRKFTSTFTEGVFISTMRARQARPPMPWASLHAMSDVDLRSLFQYIRSLPVKGDASPDYVPPGTEPKTPYIVFEPVSPAGGVPPAR